MCGVIHGVLVFRFAVLVFSNVLCIPVFKEINLHCIEAVADDVKLRIDPCLSHHGYGSKLLLVLITLHVLPG